MAAIDPLPNLHGTWTTPEVYLLVAGIHRDIADDPTTEIPLRTRLFLRRFADDIEESARVGHEALRGRP